MNGGAQPLRQLLDERDIRTVLALYCRGVDRMDLDIVRQCYHHDATDHHGTFHGGLEEFLPWLNRVLGRYTSTWHVLGQSLMEFHPAHPDVARVETYGFAVHRTDGGGAKLNLVVGFRYLDRFERRDSSTWRIAERVGTTEWVQEIPREQQWPISESMISGSRDGTDVVQSDWSSDPWPWPPRTRE